ncbi:hypothetical protein C8T65DRAFT_66744 [Cerioporus squamosus]|nr:hypothetical protein C8T65DRAFT_66744 [Cerioporus squamosus]
MPSDAQSPRASASVRRPLLCCLARCFCLHWRSPRLFLGDCATQHTRTVPGAGHRETTPLRSLHRILATAMHVPLRRPWYRSQYQSSSTLVLAISSSAASFLAPPASLALTGHKCERINNAPGRPLLPSIQAGMGKLVNRSTSHLALGGVMLLPRRRVRSPDATDSGSPPSLSPAPRARSATSPSSNPGACRGSLPHARGIPHALLYLPSTHSPPPSPPVLQRRLRGGRLVTDGPS